MTLGNIPRIDRRRPPFRVNLGLMSQVSLCPRCIKPLTTPTCPTCGARAVATRLPDADVAASLTGQILDGRFEIGALIGEGGMGKVYRGVQRPLGREVAVKVISHTGNASLYWHKRFLREAKVTSRLAHPNNIRLYDFGYTETGDLYMAMELLQGQDLAALLATQRRLEPAHAVAICRQILAALGEAHALGIVHRDLKPGNIFLCDHAGSEHVKVMDFGLAKVHADPGLSKLTRTGTVMGTPAYMPPEQARSQETDARTDLYSLGVMLFEMLVGRVPFTATTMLGLLMAQVQSPPPRLGDFRPGLPGLSGFQGLLDTLLAKDPAGRPSSAAEVMARLDSLDLSAGVVVAAAGVNDETEMMDVVVVDAMDDALGAAASAAISQLPTMHADVSLDEEATSELEIIKAANVPPPLPLRVRLPRRRPPTAVAAPVTAPVAAPVADQAMARVDVEIRLAGVTAGSAPQVEVWLSSPTSDGDTAMGAVGPLSHAGPSWTGHAQVPVAGIPSLAFRLQIRGAPGARWRLRVGARRLQRALLISHQGRVEGDRFAVQGQRGDAT